MEDFSSCKLCHVSINLKKNDRRLITSKLRGRDTSVYSAITTIYDYKGTSVGYICAGCYNQVSRAHTVHTAYSKCNPSHSTPMKSVPIKEKPVTHSKTCRPERAVKKSKVVLSSPSCSARKRLCHPAGSQACKRNFKPAFSSSIDKALKASRYYTALRRIMSTGKAAEKAFQRVVHATVRNEMRSFCKDMEYPKLDKSASVTSFDFRDLLTKMEHHMPTLLQSLRGAMPRKCMDENRTIISTRIGFMASIVLYTINPRRYSFVQALTGMQMLRCGSNEELFKLLNHLGVCQSSSAIKRHVNSLCSESDVEVNIEKDSLESSIGVPHQDSTVPSTAPSSSPVSCLNTPEHPVFPSDDCEWEDEHDEDDD